MAPDPWKEQTSFMLSGVHKHRSPNNSDGVASDYDMGGGNCMFSEYLGI